MDIRDLKVFQMIAFQKSVSKAANMGYPMPFLQYVVLIETIIAVILVVYIYISVLWARFLEKRNKLKINK